jgi:hypothetical protein
MRRSKKGNKLGNEPGNESGNEPENEPDNRGTLSLPFLPAYYSLGLDGFQKNAP